MKILRRILLALSIVGAIVVLILFGIAMTLSVTDAQHYADEVSPVILFPFAIAFMVTFVASTIVYVLYSDY